MPWRSAASPNADSAPLAAPLNRMQSSVFMNPPVRNSIRECTIQSMLETERLLLRHWKDSDREPFAKMNANPHVMEFFAGCLTKEESDQFIDRAESDIANYGFGLFAAELKETHAFIGFIGLHTTTFQAPFTPSVEIGWRIDEPY